MSKVTRNTFKKISTGFMLVAVLFSQTGLAYAVPRTNPFTIGQTIDPGAEAVEPCGPLDGNCFTAVLSAQDEGSTITNNVLRFNFVGAGVSATSTAGVVTVNIAAGGLTALTDGKIYIGNASNLPTEQTLTGDAALSNTGLLTVNIANATTRGLVSTTTQTFAGDKTFSNNILGLQGLTLTGGATIGGNATVAGTFSASGTSTLATTSATALSAQSANIANNASVSGNTTLGGTLTVAGNQTNTGNVTAGGNLSVSGNTSLATTTITNATIGTLNIVNVSAPNGTFGNLTATNTLTAATATLATTTISNATISSLFASIANFVTATINSLTGGSITATSSLVSQGTLAVTGATTLATTTFNGDLNLNYAIRDSLNATGTPGQVLSSTGTSTKWVSISGTVNNGTATGSILYWNGSAWTENLNFTTNATGNTNVAGTLNVLGTSTLATTTATNLFASIFNAVTGSISSFLFGNATGTNLTATSSLVSQGTLAVTGATTLSNILDVAGTSSLATTSATAFSAQSAAITNNANIGGILNTNGLVALNSTTTNATSTNFFATTLHAISAFFTNLSATNAVFTNSTTTNATTTGAFSANTINATGNVIVGGATTLANTLNVTGTSTLATTSITSLTANSLSVPNLALAGTLSVLGTSTFATTTSTNLFASIANFVTGSITNFLFGSATGTNLTATGTLTSTNQFNANLVNVSGTSTLATTSATALNANRLLIGSNVLDASFIDGQTLIGLTGNINNYIETNIKNLSTGNNAQSGYTATANTGTATSGFMYMGINNSGFTATSSSNVGAAGDTNILGTGNDMYIANGTANKNILFMAGGTGTASSSFVRLSINGSNGLVLVNNAFATKRGADYVTVGTTNNVDFGNTSLVRLTGVSAQTITGIAGGVDGKLLTLINAGAFTSALTNLDALSSASNQITTGTGAALALAPNASVQLIYDSGASLWRVVGGSGGSAGGFSSIDIANLASGGAIGTAAATVDTATNFNVNQTTALQALTLPNPTAPVTTKGKVITINNIGTANFIIGGITVSAGSYGSAFVWNGTQWNPINAASNVAAEYGSNNSIANTSFTTTLVDIAGSPFTIPSAGTWQVTFNVSARNDTTNALSSIGLYNSSNVLITGSSAGWQQDAAGIEQSVTRTIQVITTAAETFKLRGSTVSGTVTVRNLSAIGIGQSVITWNKITGNTPVIGQSADYISTTRITTSQLVTLGSDIVMNSVNGGNIPYNTTTGVYTLTAGKTYELLAGIGSTFSAVGDTFNYGWVDGVSNVQIQGIQQMRVDSLTSSNAFSPFNFSPQIYTPSTNQTIKLRVLASTGAGNNIQQNLSGVTIKQIGSSTFTAGTGLNFDSLRAAVASNFLDNTNFDQTWLWSTLTNTPALTMNAGALTTGSLLNLSSGSNAITTGSLFRATLTGTPTAFTGNVANISIPSASNAGNTGTLLNVSDSGLANLTKLLTLNSSSTANTNALLSLTSASAGAFINGGALFNFTGNHTNSAVKINTVTTAGTALEINPTALTTGTGINLFTASAVLNPTVGLLRVANTGASTNGILARFQSNSTAGSGLTVFSSGAVGIGTVTPGSALQIIAAINPEIQMSNNGTQRMRFGVPTTAGNIIGGSAIGDVVLGNDNGALKFGTGAGVAATRMNIDTAGVVSINNLVSCVGLQTNAAGAVSCTSDETRKDIAGNFTSGLDAVMQINPINYSWKQGTDLYDGGVVYSGFSAQNVQSAIPSGVTIGSQGQLQLNTLALVGATVNALKELNGLVFATTTANSVRAVSVVNSIDDVRALVGTTTLMAESVGQETIVSALQSLMSSTSSTSTLVSLTDVNGNLTEVTQDTFVGGVWNAMKGRMVAWFEDAANGITKFFAKEVATEKLCVGTGENVTCITKEQLDAMLSGSGASTASAGNGNSGSTGGSTGGNGNSGAITCTAPEVVNAAGTACETPVAPTPSDSPANPADEVVTVDGGATPAEDVPVVAEEPTPVPVVEAVVTPEVTATE